MNPATPRVRAIVTVPQPVQAGSVIEVRALIQHAMETGYRRDADGLRLPRNLIRRVECRFDGVLVFTAELHAAIAANPYIGFYLQVPHSGTLSLEWHGDQGFAHREQVAIRAG